MKNRGFTADMFALNSCVESSSQEFSMGADEDGRLLLRAFQSITNSELRSIIIDVVSALAWQDSRKRAQGGRRLPSAEF
jgi:hypothetical protein